MPSTCERKVLRLPDFGGGEGPTSPEKSSRRGHKRKNSKGARNRQAKRQKILSVQRHRGEAKGGGATRQGNFKRKADNNDSEGSSDRRIWAGRETTAASSTEREKRAHGRGDKRERKTIPVAKKKKGLPWASRKAGSGLSMEEGRDRSSETGSPGEGETKLHPAEGEKNLRLVKKKHLASTGKQDGERAGQGPYRKKGLAVKPHTHHLKVLLCGMKREKKAPTKMKSTACGRPFRSVLNGEVYSFSSRKGIDLNLKSSDSENDNQSL